MGSPIKYNPKKDPVVRDFVALIREKLGEHLKGVILFGSRARGDADQDSDYDFLLLMDKKSRKVKNLVNEIEYRMLDDHDALIMGLIYSEREFERRIFAPLFINVRREGIRLYG